MNNKKKTEKLKARISLNPHLNNLQNSKAQKDNHHKNQDDSILVKDLQSKIKELQKKGIELQDQLNLYTQRPKGRPSKKTLQIERDVLTVLGVGLSYRTAAGYIKVSESTLRKWRDEDDDFSAACEKAISERKLTNVARLQEKINKGSLTALIYWLKSRTEEFRERRYEIFQDAGEYDADESFL